MNKPPIVSANTQLISSAGNGLPDLSDALGEYLVDMTFTRLGKVVSGAFELVETATPTSFLGVKQPYKPTELEMEKVGQRAWAWYKIHSTSDLALSPDDIIVIAAINYRVMSVADYGDYSVFEYKIVRDYQ